MSQPESPNRSPKAPYVSPPAVEREHEPLITNQKEAENEASTAAVEVRDQQEEKDIKKEDENDDEKNELTRPLIAPEKKSAPQPSSSSPSSQRRVRMPRPIDFVAFTYCRLTMVLAYPVTITMLIVVWLSVALHPTAEQQAQSQIGFVSALNSNSTSSSKKFGVSIALVLGVVAAVTAMTFLMVLLVKYRCMKLLKFWMCMSAGSILFALSWATADLVCTRYQIAYDWASMAIVLWNFGIVGMFSLFWHGSPRVMQGYLIILSCVVAWLLNMMLPTWTTWVLLVGMALYDLAAVLCPKGPLKMLVQLSDERNEQLVGFVYDSSNVVELEPERPAPRPKPAAKPAPKTASTQKVEKETVDEKDKKEEEASKPSRTRTASGASKTSLEPPKRRQLQDSTEEGESMQPAQAEEKNKEGKEKTKEQPTNSTGNDADGGLNIQENSPLQGDLDSTTGDVDRQEVEEKKPSIPPFWGMSLTPGCEVEMIWRDGPAWLAGVRLGDKILEIAGVAVTDKVLCAQAVHKSSVGEPIVIKVFSQAENMAVECGIIPMTNRPEYKDVCPDLFFDVKKHTKMRLNEPKVAPVTAQNSSSTPDDDKEDPFRDAEYAQPFHLGLGDFIFYSILVGRAAIFTDVSWMSCAATILVGLIGTLCSLLFIRADIPALPALPISIFLGVAIYFIGRYTIVPLCYFYSDALLVF